MADAEHHEFKNWSYRVRSEGGQVMLEVDAFPDNGDHLQMSWPLSVEAARGLLLMLMGEAEQAEAKRDTGAGVGE